MEIIALAVTCVLLGALLLMLLRRSGDDAAVRELARSVAELRLEVERSSGTTERSVLAQTGATQRALGDVAHELGLLEAQGARVAELARDIGSLSDLLRAPQPRGELGELLLERVLADLLPASAFSLQHGFADGSRVDAVVRFGDRLVPIDAKFPIDAFAATLEATDEEERRARRHAFAQRVRRHVDAVARYVVPAEGTIDFAFLYVPSEAVFSALLAAGDAGLGAYSSAKRVILASPNTLAAYLRVVSLGLRGLAIADGARELEARAGQAVAEVGRLKEAHRVLGTHLENAVRKHHETTESIGRASAAIENLARASEGEPG